jgi:hypothetical protein
MPCPFFEPQQIAPDPMSSRARLPLIDEYGGVCHAADQQYIPPPDVRFRFCNHGYSRGACDHFPSAETRSCLRYDIVRRTLSTLDLICVEESGHLPLKWYTLQYQIGENTIQADSIDGCVRSQALAFCRSYLEHFPNS